MFKSLLLPWKHRKTKVMVPEQTMEDEEVLEEQRLSPCSTCGRTFLPRALRKHAPICEKNAAKKRRVFDSLKQRVEGTDLAQFHQKSYLKRQDSIPKTAEKVVKKANRWEESHQKLVDAIRTAKGASRETSSVTAAPREMSSTKKPHQLSSSNERCPFCERNFGPKAFDRHVEWCKEHRTRIQKSPANVLLAKERLEARIKYKVPPLNKSKRSVVKDKYSNTAINRTESVCSVKSTPPSKTPVKTTPTVKKPRSVLDLEVAKAKEPPVKSYKKKDEVAVNAADAGAEELFAVDDKMYAEYKIYEEMYLKEKEQKQQKKKQKEKISLKAFGIDIGGNDDGNNLTCKISDDSAYGSLNRNSPKPKTTKLSPLQRKRIDSASSSGSENYPTSPAVNHRMSKFCHECGTKFPLTTAKFCVECGVKRLVL